MDNKENKNLGIYVHIPFCRSKCEYCDFYSVGGARDKELISRYQRALITHIKEAAERAPGYVVDTIYFGGGTPSYYGSERLRELLGEIGRRFHVDKGAEITIEANPDSVNLKMLKRLRKAGVNRISIGVQSDSDDMLKVLGRPHSFAQSQAAVTAAREAGFDNVSIDLMYGLPSQTREGWATTLGAAIAMKPNHISAYGLKLEPGTRMHEYREYINLPDDDAQADMYLYCVQTLADCGYEQYEISNFAKEGFHSRHNFKYWTGQEYIGFGPSASSDFGNKRYTYISNLQKYITAIESGGSIITECETIPARERAGEYLMLRLRTTEGVAENEYRSTFLMDFSPVEEALAGLKERGYAEKSGGRWRLTPEGFLISNTIIGDLIEIQSALVPQTRRY